MKAFRKQGPEMKLKTVLGFLRDVAIAAGIIGLLLLILFLYTANWPPMVVIESDSMQHGDDSSIGVIDTGDLVLVKRIDSRKEITTYVEGRAKGYETYSDYGDVIIYRKNGGSDTPVIHRSVLFLEVNSTTNSTFDIPELAGLEYGLEGDWFITRSEQYGIPLTKARWYNISKDYDIYLNSYGFGKVRLKIDMNNINKSFRSGGIHGGFLTVGDHNAQRDCNRSVDQGLLDAEDGSVRPVKVDWIVGKGKGELPWFGIVKLKVSGNTNEFPSTSIYMIFVSLAVVIALPIVIDYIYHRIII